MYTTVFKTFEFGTERHAYFLKPSAIRTLSNFFFLLARARFNRSILVKSATIRTTNYLTSTYIPQRARVPSRNRNRGGGWHLFAAPKLVRPRRL